MRFGRVKQASNQGWGWIERHPLAAVMIVAVGLRVIAVLFSKGYMASDDHFQTVTVAYHWLRHGLWGPDGFLSWNVDGEVSRFPLYNLILWLNMRIAYSLGVESLDGLMYSVRAVQAAFSLIGVWAVYRLVELASRSWKWALGAGLVAAAHFAMPYLAVRNLVEMAGANFWVLSLYFLYRYRDARAPGHLFWSALTAGIAWMMRFQLAFAWWLIPLVLWYDERRIRPALGYAAVSIAMALVAGLVDWAMTGTFMGSSLLHVTLGAVGPPPYETSPFIYVAVVIGYFIPPFSLVVGWMCLRWPFVRQHLALIASSLSFILIHSVIAYRQERYLIPLIPVLIALGTLALHHHYLTGGWLTRRPLIRRALYGFTIVVNLAALCLFTSTYGHRGQVEALVRIESNTVADPTLLIVYPEQPQDSPLDYAGYNRVTSASIRNWDHLDSVTALHRYDFVLFYPHTLEDLAGYVDSLTSRLGPLKQYDHIGPSNLDYVLHVLNPRHNRTNEAWIFTPLGRN